MRLGILLFFLTIPVLDSHASIHELWHAPTISDVATKLHHINLELASSTASLDKQYLLASKIRILLDQGNLQESETLLNTLQQLPNLDPFIAASIQALFNDHSGSSQTSLHGYEQLLSSAYFEQNDSKKAWLLVQIAKHYYHHTYRRDIKKLNKGKEYLSEALSIYQSNLDIDGIILANYTILLYESLTGSKESTALKKNQLRALLSKHTNNTILANYILFSMHYDRLYSDKSQFRRALTNVEAILPRNVELTLASYYFAKTLDAQLHSDFENGISYAKRAISIYEKRKMLSKVMVAQGMLGEILEKAGFIEEAVEHLNIAFSIASKLNHRNAQIINLASIGDIQLILRQYDNALNTFETLYALAKDSSVMQFRTKAHLRLGKIYIIKGRYAQAKQHLNAAQELQKKDKDQLLALHISLQQSKLAFHTESLKNALTKSDIVLSQARKLKNQFTLAEALFERAKATNNNADILHAISENEKMLDTSNMFNIIHYNRRLANLYELKNDLVNQVKYLEKVDVLQREYAVSLAKQKENSIDQIDKSMSQHENHELKKSA